MVMVKMKSCHHSSKKPSLEINFVEHSPPQVHVPTCLHIDCDDDDDGDNDDDEDDDNDDDDDGDDDDDDDKEDDDDDMDDDDNDITWPLASLTRISTVSLNTLLPLQINIDRRS